MQSPSVNRVRLRYPLGRALRLVGASVPGPCSKRQHLLAVTSHPFPAICLYMVFVVLVLLLFQLLSVFLSQSCVFCI